MSSHLVHEPTDDAFDLDAGPVTLEAATEPKERPGWLDADSVSPALGRDKALVARMLAMEHQIMAALPDYNVASSRCGALRRTIFAPPLAALRRALRDRSLSIADAAWFLAAPSRSAAAQWPELLRRLLAGDAADDDDDEAPKLFRCCAGLLALAHCGDGAFAVPFAAAGGGGALGAVVLDRGAEPGVKADCGAALAALGPTLEFAALERSMEASLATAEAPAPAEAADSDSVDSEDATWNRVHSPTKAAARPPADDALAAVLRAAKLEAFAPKFAEEKVGLGDLYEALDEGLDELSQLLAECGLKAGERSKLRRALDKARA